MACVTPKICYLTAGAADMYCGNCLRDNTLATALISMGCDIQLFPTYTPTRTDEPNVSEDKVLLGGINIYLQQKFALFRNLPPTFDRWLNNSRLIQVLASDRLATSGHEVGKMTLSLLRGELGHQRKELQQMVGWIKDHVRPDLVSLTNALISGCVSLIKEELGIPVLVTLQGEDLFLEETPEPYRTQILDELRKLVHDIDGFIVFNRYYADFMSDYLAIPREKMHLAQAGIQVNDFKRYRNEPDGGVRTIGYLARICPEKGLHLLVDAFIRLRQMPGNEDVRLKVAGWMGSHQQAFLNAQIDKLKTQGLGEELEYLGVLDRPEKIKFLKGLDVFSVPTTYPDPNGLYAMEALAAGVPVVQPRHGMFPEFIEATGGGLLVSPYSAEQLAIGLNRLLSDSELRTKMAKRGQENVFDSFSANSMAESVLEVYGRFTLRDLADYEATSAMIESTA
jgi:glycosyltransferase involved in cell wall biosynthesis